MNEEEGVQIDTSSKPAQSQIDFLKVNQEELKENTDQATTRPSPLKRLGDKIKEVSSRANEIFQRVKQRRVQAMKERLTQAAQEERLRRNMGSQNEKVEKEEQKAAEAPSQQLHQPKAVPIAKASHGISRMGGGAAAAGNKLGSRWKSRFS